MGRPGEHSWSVDSNPLMDDRDPCWKSWGGWPGKVSIRISNAEPCRDLRVWDGRGRLLCGKMYGNRAGSPGVAGRGSHLLVDRRPPVLVSPVWLGGESYLRVKDRYRAGSPGVAGRGTMP
jgi:hypothetical protein